MITDPNHLLAARLLWIAGALAMWVWMAWMDKLNPKAKKSSFLTNLAIMLMWPLSAAIMIAYTAYLVAKRMRK